MIEYCAVRRSTIFEEVKKVEVPVVPKKKSIWDEFDQETEKERVVTKSVSNIEIELTRYREALRLKRTLDPLKWWNENERNFPHLAKLAKKYLAILATSVPSERVFSKAGEIVSARRSRIKSKHVDMLIFLNKL